MKMSLAMRIISYIAVIYCFVSCGGVACISLGSDESPDKIKVKGTVDCVRSSITRIKRGCDSFINSRMMQEDFIHLENITAKQLPFDEITGQNAENAVHIDSCNWPEILNERRDEFIVHRDTLITFHGLITDCINASNVLNKDRLKLNQRINQRLRCLVRCEDWGLHKLVLNFEPLTSFHVDSATFNWTMSKCSMAKSPNEFEESLVNIIQTLHNYMRILRVTMEPIFAHCGTSGTAHRPVLASSLSYSSSHVWSEWSLSVFDLVVLGVAVIEGIMLLLIATCAFVKRLAKHRRGRVSVL